MDVFAKGTTGNGLGLRIRNLGIGIALLVFMVAFGTTGYMLLEGWSFADALYMTVITLSTVGYREVHEISPAGRVFTMALIVMGVGLVFYLASSVMQFMMEGRVREILGRRQLERRIRSQQDHYIVCGYGRVGSCVCDILASSGLGMVVVDRDSGRIEKLDERRLLHIVGEATDEEVLLKAGIKKARGLVAALKTDSDNVFVTLAARQLNPELLIIARAAEEASEKTLLAAGANSVVSPYLMGAHRIAQTILRPTVTDFLELTLTNKMRDIQMEEFPVDPASELIDVALQDSGVRSRLDLIIVAIRKSSGEMLFNPSSKTRLKGGDTVVAIGEKQNLEQLEKILTGSARHIL